LKIIQLTLNDKLKLPTVLRSEVDYITCTNLKKISEAIESVRQIIDDHEKKIIQQIEENATKEKKQIEEYEKRLEREQQSFNVQNALFETLNSTKNNIKLLQLKGELVNYTKMTFEHLIALELPTTINYNIEGLDQLPALKENILQYGYFVEIPPYSNPNLVARINNNHIKSRLSLSHQGLTAQDMKIVTNELRTNLVRRDCIFFL
jgi:hypothetical protein